MGAPTLAKEQGCGEVAELMDALVGTVLSRLRGGWLLSLGSPDGGVTGLPVMPPTRPR